MPSTLQAWLEYQDESTGTAKRIELVDLTTTLGSVCLSRVKDRYIIKDMGSPQGTFLNDRRVLEAELTNLDEIRTENKILTFRAAYLPPPPPETDVEERTEPQLVLGTGPLWPHNSLLNPKSFWPQALETHAFQLRRTWPIHGLSLIALIAETSANSTSSGAAIHLGFLLLANTLALGLLAITCSVFFERMGHALRFTFCISPLLLAAQCGFLIWAGSTHPKTAAYFAASLLPTAFVWIYGGLQSSIAFQSPFSRGLSFALTASVPWNIFMTGLMSLIV